jgi:hypothetical protein
VRVLGAAASQSPEYSSKIPFFPHCESAPPYWPYSMSRTPLASSSRPSSNFKSIFDAALNEYKNKTKNDLVAHRFTAQLETCTSPSAILAALDEQYHIQDFVRSNSGDGGSKQWLNATVNVLSAFSATIGGGVSLVSFITSSHNLHSNTRP